jgi:hypothetical protein
VKAYCYEIRLSVSESILKIRKDKIKILAGEYMNLKNLEIFIKK